jgi:hypothetical protein
MAPLAIDNLRRDIPELRAIADKVVSAGVKRQKSTMGWVQGVATNDIFVPAGIDTWDMVQAATTVLCSNQLGRSEMRNGPLSEHSMLIPVFLDSAERHQLSLVSRGPNASWAPNVGKIKELFPNSTSCVLQKRPPPRALLGRKDAPSSVVPKGDNSVWNLVVRFGTEEEVTLTRAEYVIYVHDVQGYGRKLCPPLFSFPAEYPWWRGRWLDKIQVKGVVADSMDKAVRKVMRPISQQLGRGFVEPTPDAARVGSTYTVYLHAYGMTNALLVIQVLRKLSMVASGRHPSLRWCSYCEVAGHDRSTCGLPVIMIRCWKKLNGRTISAYIDETGAIDGFMGAARTANMYDKKFALFIYQKDLQVLLAATKFFAALDRLGQFSAIPRVSYGRPDMCTACGMLKDEADAAKVRWHQAGDGACKKHEYDPPSEGRLTESQPERDRRPAFADTISDNDTAESLLANMDKLTVSSGGHP